MQMTSLLESIGYKALSHRQGSTLEVDVSKFQDRFDMPSP